MDMKAVFLKYALEMSIHRRSAWPTRMMKRLKPSNITLDASRIDNSKESKESYVEKLKRHPLIATIILVTAIIGATATLVENLDTLKGSLSLIIPCWNKNIDERPSHCLRNIQ
jgi:hypothetical protein